jgi:hypothetical protein
MSNYPTDPQEATADIARQLQENHFAAINQIRRIIESLGIEAAYADLARALQIEAEGGMLTQDGRRRRSAGGVFFYLVRGHITLEQFQFIWPTSPAPRFLDPQGQQPAGPAREKRLRPALKWQAGLAELPQLLAEQGMALTAKLTLVGRPGKVIDKGDVILTTLVSQKLPTLPKGLPEAPADPTVYLLFIARKQWQKVAAALAENAADKLIVEGYPVLDKTRGVIAVLAQSATTAGLQRARREQGSV